MVSRGIYRRTLAAGVLVACLFLAVPGGADAWWFSAPSRGQGESGPEEAEAREVTLWAALWEKLEILWGASVFINPEGEGSDDDDDGSGEGGSNANGGEDNHSGNNSGT